MKNQSNIYKFSTADVISYINQNIDLSNNIVKIIKKTTKVDDKTINKISIVNDIMSKVGELIITVKDKLNINSKTLKSIKVSISNITEILSLLLDNIIFKIISISLWASLSLSSLIVIRIYTIILHRFISKLFDDFGIITNFKISILNDSFNKICNIIDNLIYISRKLSILGVHSLISIPLIKLSSRYIYHLGKFMRTLYLAFSVKKIVKISLLKIYFDTLNVVSDLILSVTGKLIKLGMITLLTSWVLKPATKYIIQLHIFNSLILALFRKRDIIGMFIMEKYFDVLSDIIMSIIGVSNQLIKLRFIVRVANRVLKKHIFKYIVNLGVLCYMITHFFKARNVIKLKLIQIQFKILNDVINSITQIARNIIKNAIFLMIANHLMKKVNVFIWRLKKFVNNLKHLFKISIVRLIGIKFKLRILRGIVNQLILLSSSIIILGLISFIAIPALVVNTIYVVALGAFIKVLQIMLRIAKIKLKDILALTILNIAIGLLITLSLGVLALSNIGKKIDWKSLLIMMGALLMVSVFSILIGFAAMAIIGVIGLAMVGLMALIMLIGVLFVIAGMLYVLQIIELDTEIIKGNIKFLLGLCEEIAVIVKDKLNKESLKAIGIATLNLGALLPMTVVLLLLAGELWLLQHIDLNRDKIRETVETVIGTATSIINMIFGEKEEPEAEKSDKTWIGGLLEGVGGFMGNLKVVLDAILAVGFLATTVASVAIILLIGKLLNKVSELNIDENISQKVGKIIETAKNISKQVLGTSDSTAQVVKQEEKSWLGKTWDNIKGFGGKVINTATSLISNIGAAGVLATILPSIMMLGSIVDLIQSINDLKLDPNINNKVANIVDLAKNITSQVSSSKTIGSIDEDKVDLFGEYVDDSIKYFKGINNLKIDNVKSLTDMYVKMGEFMDKLSDAPISEIADALVNKISPALSDINNNLDKKTTSTTSQQNTQQTSTTSQQNIQQIDYTTILENIEDLLEKIKQKMNENTQLSFS